MKTKSITIILILALGLLISCDHESIRASDEVSTLDYAIPEYSTMHVSSAFNTYVTFSDTEESIRIEANENIHNRIIVQREGNSLVIKLKKFTSIRGNAILNAYIVTKDISNFDISGASKLILENIWNIENGNIELSGDAEFIGEIAANRLNLDTNGASTIDLYGSVVSMHADLSGSSEIKDYDLSVEDLVIDLSGASEAFLSISQTIDIEASGASELNYKGNASIIHKDLSGASKIINNN